MADSTDPKRWVARAEIEFVRAVRDVNEYPESVAVQLQFCIELYLKAVMLHANQTPPKMHDLEELLDLIAPELDEDAGELSAANLLILAGFGGRYPGQRDEANEKEARAMLEAPQLLRTFAQARLGLEAA